MSLRLKRRGERALERALDPGDEDEEHEVGASRSASSNKKTLHPGPSTNVVTSGTNTLGRRSSAVRPNLQVQETIQEAEEPLTPNPGAVFGTLHRRESAGTGR